MKRFIFWSTVLLALSGTMMGMAQENNVFPFTTDVIAVYKKDVLCRKRMRDFEYSF